MYTPRQVDALIPQLEDIFKHIDALGLRIRELAGTRPPIAAHPTAAEVAQAALIRSQMEFLLQGVQEDIDGITQLGGAVKDVESGLVDFAGQVNGEEVWLCWKRGESHIGFWHPLSTGFSDRRALKQPSRHSRTTH